MTQLDESKIKEAVEQIGQRAQTDDAFRELCLNDPNAAVKEALGVDLHENFSLRFVENEGADLSIVLPDLLDEDQLSEKDLEAVAGGFSPDVIEGIGDVASATIEATASLADAISESSSK